MSTKPIRVIQTNPSECRVVPPVEFLSQRAQAGAPDNLRFINLTNGPIDVFLPSGTFGAASVALRTIDVGGEGATPNVSPEADIGARPYTVYCKATNTNAIGNSDPQVVVEP